MVYKVYYFNVKALAEPIRFILSYGGIPFEDVRVSYEDWPEVKKTMPLGQMPAVEIDGKLFYQSNAIYRFLSKKVGLAGENDLEEYEIDNVIDTINDLKNRIAMMAYEKDPKAKEAKMKILVSDSIPFYISKLEEIAAKGFMALDRITRADVYLGAVYDYMSYMAEQDLFVNTPNLRKVIDKVLANENIQKWMEKNPNVNRRVEL